MAHLPSVHSSVQKPNEQLRTVHDEPVLQSRWHPSAQSLVHMDDCAQLISQPPPVHWLVHTEPRQACRHPPLQFVSQVEPLMHDSVQPPPQTV
jgi:hypothetical protein